MEDKIKQLEERINKLESNITKLFGKSFRTVGNTESDLLLKTRGNIKVQYGQSFSDVFKDGKLNVNIDVIKKVDKLESTNGIYIVGSDVYLVCDGDSFKLN